MGENGNLRLSAVAEDTSQQQPALVSQRCFMYITLRCMIMRRCDVPETSLGPSVLCGSIYKMFGLVTGFIVLK